MSVRRILLNIEHCMRELFVCLFVCSCVTDINTEEEEKTFFHMRDKQAPLFSESWNLCIYLLIFLFFNAMEN